MKKKVTKQALRQSEEKYRTLVENFPNGAVGLFDQNLRYTALGGELVSAVGLDPQERIGNKITDIYPEEIVEEVKPHFIATLGGQARSFEAELHNRKLLAQTLPIKNDKGEVIAGMLVVQDDTDRWEAQQALRQSEEKYRTLFETMDEGFCIIKMMFDEHNKPVNFRYLVTNPAYYRHSGLEYQQIEGKTAKEVLPDLGEDILQRNGKVALTGEPFHDEIYVEEIDRWLDLSVFRVGDPDERTVAVLFNDITDRKENELAYAYLGAIVENSDDAIVSKDLDGIITSWNNSAERIFGYSAEEAIGQPITIIIPDERIEEETDILNRIRNGEMVDYFETVRRRKDGTLLDISLNISPIKNSEGAIVGASKIARDITERKELEEKRNQLLREIKNDRKQLSDIFRQAPSFMCVQRGPDHVYERANDLYRQLIGDREIIGKPVREVLPDLEGQGYFELLDQVYETGKPYVGTEMKVVLKHPNSDKEPEERYLDFVYQPLQGPNGEVNGIFTQGVDLTERKKAKEELKAMNETLEKQVKKRTQSLVSYQNQLRSLVAELSRAEEQERQRLASDLHDNLGQMLAVGKIKIGQVQKDRLPDSEAKNLFELAELIDDAITYTRELTSDLKPPASLDEEDLKAHINWVTGKMKKHGLEVTIEDDERPKPLDKEVRMTLLQCVRELLFNVIKHASVNEAIVIMKRHEECVQVTVRDEGEGFDPAHKELTPDQEGGFGLFSIRERIDMLGGRVNLSSDPGKGTEVTLYVPLKGTDIESPDRERSQRHEKSEMIKILLADNPYMMRDGLRTMIEKEDDMTVIGEADDGKEAVKMARNLSPDIILMEINLPKLNGVEATKNILEEDPQIRIIGLSDQDVEKVAQDMHKAGACSFISKKEAFQSLVSSIRAEASAQK